MLSKSHARAVGSLIDVSVTFGPLQVAFLMSIWKYFHWPVRPLAGVEECFIPQAEGFPFLARDDAPGCPAESCAGGSSSISSAYEAAFLVKLLVGSQQLPAEWGGFFFVLLWCISSIWSNFFCLMLLLIIVFRMTLQLPCRAAVGAVLQLMALIALLPALCLLVITPRGFFFLTEKWVFMERYKRSCECMQTASLELLSSVFALWKVLTCL